MLINPEIRSGRGGYAEIGLVQGRSGALLSD
jgi:hypothetical protein